MLASDDALKAFKSAVADAVKPPNELDSADPVGGRTTGARARTSAAVD